MEAEDSRERGKATNYRGATGQNAEHTRAIPVKTKRSRKSVRRENIRIYGVPEGAEGDPKLTISFVKKLIRDNLTLKTCK